MRLLAGLYLLKGDNAKGFELAKTAHNLAPNDDRVSEILGRLAYSMHDYRWSLSLLKDAAADRPDDPDAQYDLGKAYYSLGFVSEAESSVRRALDLSSQFGRRDEAAKFLELVKLGDDSKNAATQLSRLNSLVSDDAEDIPAWMAKGEANEQTGSASEAIHAYETVLAHFPDFKPAEKRLIVLYSKDPANGTKGLELATKVREAFPKDPEVAKACGIVDYHHGEYRRAEDLLSDGASQLSDDAELVYYLGMAQYHLKEKSSRSTLEHALSMDLSTELASEVRRILTQVR